MPKFILRNNNGMNPCSKKTGFVVNFYLFLLVPVSDRDALVLRLCLHEPRLNLLSKLNINRRYCELYNFWQQLYNNHPDKKVVFYIVCKSQKNVHSYQTII